MTESTLHIELAIGALARAQKYIGKALESMPYNPDEVTREALKIARAQAENATASARRALDLFDQGEKKEVKP